MTRFTVTWKSDAKVRLAEMWNDNPLLREEISSAADEIDLALAVDPQQQGMEFSTATRRLVVPPLAALFAVSEGDRTVRVIYVKFWDD
jgi:hypothetical protein